MTTRRLKIVMILAALLATSLTAEPKPPVVPDGLFAGDLQRPIVACTAVELERLRAAADEPAIRGVLDQADAFLAETVVYPPRGGQHNQWYQCEKCQLGLKTLSPTEHKCPKCGTVYSGAPYDDVVFKRVHHRNLAGMRQCAWAYAITGNRKYARRGIEVLTGYADRYEAYPYHSAHRAELQGKYVSSGGHIDEQTLGEAMIMSRQVGPAYDLLFDEMPPEQREHIRAHLVVPMLKNIAKHNCGRSNWQTWHNAAMIVGGAAIEDPGWVRRAITDEKNGFFYQMDASVTDDGMWYENSWGYHFYTLMAMVEIVEAARRLDIDLWSHPRLKRMFTLPARYALPGDALPRFGDDVNSNVRRAAPLSEVAYHAFGDPALLPLLSDKPSWLSVLYGRDVTVRAESEAAIRSAVFRTAGHAILRTDGPGRLAAAVTFGPYGGFHGHLDKLSFVLYGHGRELGVDPGRAASQAYRLPIHRQWYKATIGHNAVLVDHASQKPATGTLLSFGSNEQFAGAVMACDDCWEDVRYHRVLVLTPRCLIVFDQLDATTDEHAFEWLYHNRGTAAACDAAAEPVDLARHGEGFSYIRNARQGRAGNSVDTCFNDGEVVTRVIGAATASMDITTGDGPFASVLDRVPMMMLAQHGRSARFAAAIMPTTKGGRPPFDTIRIVGASAAETLVLESKGETQLTIEISGDAVIRVLDAGGACALKTEPES